MGLRNFIALCLISFSVISASAQDPARRIFRTFNCRYHCGGNWYDFQLSLSPAVGLLGMPDPDAGITARLNVLFYRSVTRLDPASYYLTGPYDTKTGRFRLEPKRWIDDHPAALEMIGIEGRFDAATETMTAKMLSSKCDAVEIAPPGKALPPLPAAPPNRAADPNRPEMLLGPSNVTNYLDVSAQSPYFEYWVTAWSDHPGTIHEGEPIDEAVDGMKSSKFACVGSSHVTWDATGLKGTAPDGLGIITQRYVIECVGDCKGLFYRPWIAANVTHFGFSAPLPTFQIKSMQFGEISFEWRFSRKKNTQPAPEIYVHRWTPLVGFGPMDPGPAEVARRQAAAPPCRAPKAGNK